METPLRFCTVHIQGIATLREDIPVDKVTNIKPYFEGTVGPVTNLVINSFWSPINYTMSVASSVGADGCQGMIARNESDASLSIVDFPVNEDYEKVNPAVTVIQEPLFIFQMYNRTHRRQLVDIVGQSFQSFSVSLWMSIVCFVLFMGIFLKMRQKVLHDPGPKLDYFEMRRDWWLRKRKPWEQDTSYPFFESFSCFIQQDSNDFSDATRRIITLIISISSLVIITGYFCNLMATDMVFVDKPHVMNSYDDILDRPGVIATFIKETSTWERFRDADKDSSEYKLWKVMTTERSTKDKILGDDAEEKASYGLRELYGSLVRILPKWSEFGTRATYCQLNQALNVFPDLMSWAAVDPDSPSYASGFILRQAKIPFLKTAVKRLRRAVEAGLAMIMKKEMDETGFTAALEDKKIDWELFRDCMSPTVVVEKPGYQAANLANYRSLAIFVVISLSISFAILIMENIYFFWKYGGRSMPKRIITV